jgi:integrase
MHSRFIHPAAVQTAHNMDPEPAPFDTETTPTLAAAIDKHINSGSKAGNYQQNTRYILDRFQSYIIGNTASDAASDADTESGSSGHRTVSILSTQTVANYAAYLNRRHRAYVSSDGDSGITASTAWIYLNTVSAFLSYCTRWGWIETNYAQKQLVKDEMPRRPSPDSSEQQFWTPEKRQSLLSYVDSTARAAVDEKGLAATTELRNRVLVYVLAYTGVRGGEILSDPRDDRRNGITWDDVAIDDSTIKVLGKNQNWEPVVLPEQTHQPLRQLHRAVDPNPDWPVIHSDHSPSIYRQFPDDYPPESEPDRSPLEHCLQLDVAPPSLTTNGARNVLKRLCDAAEISLDGDYLKPHGARRGVGEKLYRSRGAEAAQRTLRHADPSTTSQMYSHIESSELADDVGDVFTDE